jgi:hypothetical protein
MGVNLINLTNFEVFKIASICFSGISSLQQYKDIFFAKIGDKDVI